MSKNILILGGAGYIGSHMVLALLDQGYEVVVFDNFSRGHESATYKAPLIKGDIRNLVDLTSCFEKYKFDAVMHFAALAYVGESVLYPNLYYENNVVGTINLLQMMQKYSIDKIIFSSSCATYGEPDYLPVREDHTQRPINPYGQGKLMVEQILRDYGKAFGLKSISLRYFNAAGCDSAGRAGERHDPETHLIPLILTECKRVLDGGDPMESNLKIFGNDFNTTDGTCVRDYIHVTDLVEGHLAALDRLFDVQQLPVRSNAEYFNLYSGYGFSVQEVIDTCRQITGINIFAKVCPRRSGDPAVLMGSNILALNTLKWKPSHSTLNEIVETAWRWIKNN